MNFLKRGRRASVSATFGSPKPHQIVWEGWLKKASENHTNWKERYAKVYFTDALRTQSALSYYTTDKVDTKEKGHLLLTDTITYYCCEINDLPTVLLILPTRTWIFSFTSSVLMDAFCTHSLQLMPQGKPIKEGFMKLGKRKQYVIVLSTGYALLFRTKQCFDYEDCFNLTTVSSVETDSNQNSTEHRLILTTNPYETTMARHEKKVQDKEELRIAMDKLKVTLNKKVRKFSELQQQESEDAQVVHSLDKSLNNPMGDDLKLSQAAEKNMNKYLKKWDQKTVAMKMLHKEITGLEKNMVEYKKNAKIEKHTWNLLSLKDSGFMGYLLGPKAELSSWLLALEDSRNGTTSGSGGHGGGGHRRGGHGGGGHSGGGSHGGGSHGGGSRKEKRDKDKKDSHLGETENGRESFSGGSGKRSKGNPSKARRKTKHHHKREENEVVEDAIRKEQEELEKQQKRERKKQLEKQKQREDRKHQEKQQQRKKQQQQEKEARQRHKEEEEEVLPQGWNSSEAVHPSTQKKQSYFFHQESTEGNSATWEKPTEPYRRPAQQPQQPQQTQQPQQSQQPPKKSIDPLMSLRRLSHEGKKLLSQHDTSSMFPGQKCHGTSKDASKEASQWARGKTLRVMLLTMHEISYLIKEPMLSDARMNNDPEVEMKNITKAYRKTIRLLHPDRTTRRRDVSEYEKLLGSTLFALLKDKMSG
jgi:hypothetical protein